MHDHTLLRETLASVSRWKGRRVIVHVDVAVLNKEKYTAPLISDALLLQNVGIEMHFLCTGKGAQAFADRSRERGVDAVVIGGIDDIPKLAESFKAVKVFFLCDGDGIFRDHILIREMTVQESASMVGSGCIAGTMQKKLRLAVQMLNGGCVHRVHFANGRKEGAFLDEFLSSKGSGTMVYKDQPPYKKVRSATVDDVVDITHVIRSIDSSIVEEVVASHINDLMVYSVDGHVHAVAMVLSGQGVVKVEYLAHSTEFDASESLYALLECVINMARQSHAKKIVVESFRAPALIGIWPWFIRLGFKKNGNSHKLWEKQV